MIIVQNERIILIGGVKQPPGKQEFTALWGAVNIYAQIYLQAPAE